MIQYISHLRIQNNILLAKATESFMRPIFKYLQRSILLLCLCSPALGDVDLETCQLEVESMWYVCSTGDRYKLEGGSFVNGKIEGPAVYEQANGAKYIGNYKEGLPHGQGTQYYPDGRRYEGNFKNGSSHGQGTFYHSDGSRYEGEWAEGQASGQGTFYYSNGGKYVGEWVNNEFNGQGTFYYSNGDKYVGEWVNSEFNGQGTYYYTDGSRYEGEWLNYKLNGFATTYLPNGKIDKQGVFKDDEFLYSAAPPSNKRPNSVDTNSESDVKTLDSAKTTCAEIGYKIGTEKYADCVMKLLN